MTTDYELPAEKVIEVLRRQLDEANWKTALATASAETAAARAAKAENRVTELESMAADALPEK